MKNQTILDTTYNILIIDGNYVPNHVMTFTRLFLNDIKMGADYEFIYALNEIVEDVMSLKIGESLQFKPNRDYETQKGVIVRIK